MREVSGSIPDVSIMFLFFFFKLKISLSLDRGDAGMLQEVRILNANE